MEHALLQITQIPEEEWIKLRSALEQVALLTIKEVPGNMFPFLYFHPVLIPYLRSLRHATDKELYDRYVSIYISLALKLRGEDYHYPLAVRAVTWRELPNLRRTLELLLDEGNVGAASILADLIVWFLDCFGLWRERDALWRRLAEAAAVKGSQGGETLTAEEYLREMGRGEYEFDKGDLRAAYARFATLLTRADALPEGGELAPGSHQYSRILQSLALCLRNSGKPSSAETLLKRAMELWSPHLKDSKKPLAAEAQLGEEKDWDKFLKRDEEEQVIRHQATLLRDLGSVLRYQGKYLQAREVYQEGLQLAEQLADLSIQGSVRIHLGNLAVEQKAYDEARSQFSFALELLQTLGEPTREATVWHNLGAIELEQNKWTEAERCFRQSLILAEQGGDIAKAASCYHNLGRIAKDQERSIEAEGWYKRALVLLEQIQPDSSLSKRTYSILADLLVEEVQAGRAPLVRLIEARSNAELALTLQEISEAPLTIWDTLATLATIAKLEGRAEAARNYHRRACETFAAFPGNRINVDRISGPTIAAIAAAAKGDIEARKDVEALLPEPAVNGPQPITTAIWRIWEGARDWYTLVDDLDIKEALIVLRVLETLAQPTEVQDQMPGDA